MMSLSRPPAVFPIAAMTLALVFMSPAVAQTQHQHGPSQASAAHAAEDAPRAIRQLLLATFDRPEARLSVDPIVVEGDHAVAGWLQDGRGGRALLRRSKGAWVVWLCSGESLRSADTLRKTGIAAGIADTLAKRLQEAEARLPAASRAAFDSFEGTVMVSGGDGVHPPTHGAHPHSPGHAPKNSH